MTANGEKSEPVSPVSSEASAGTTAAMDESPNGGAEAAAPVATTAATTAATPSSEDLADAAAFKEAANKDFKGTRRRGMSSRSAGSRGERQREKRA